MFVIRVLVNFTPDDNATGFQDFITLSVDGVVLWSGMCSTAPNGFQAIGRKKWRDVYSWIAPSVLSIKLIEKHRRFGSCFLINSGEEVKSRIANVNHKFKKVMSEIFLHKALGIINKNWRGSAGCLTMPKKNLSQIIKIIQSRKLGTEGVIIISDNSDLQY